MVDNFFRQNELTNNSNFIGDSETPKTIYKIHVRGKKEVIVQQRKRYMRNYSQAH